MSTGGRRRADAQRRLALVGAAGRDQPRERADRVGAAGGIRRARPSRGRRGRRAADPLAAGSVDVEVVVVALGRGRRRDLDRVAAGRRRDDRQRVGVAGRIDHEAEARRIRGEERPAAPRGRRRDRRDGARAAGAAACRGGREECRQPEDEAEQQETCAHAGLQFTSSERTNRPSPTVAFRSLNQSRITLAID